MTGSPERVRVEVLGPLRVLAPDGTDVTPRGALQHRLLALLVLRRGRVVTADAAVDALWPSAPPADPAGALQNHVSRLRQHLPALVTSVDDGYRLDPDGVDVDADRLAAALAAPDTGRDELDALLARWSGPAYPELADLDEGRIAADHLEELRTRAHERRAEIRLAQGDTAGLVADLTALVDHDPLRERPRALLMQALAATGAHAEALRTYDDLRRRLAEELGIEPSVALAAQHAALLAGGSTPWPSSVPATSIVGAPLRRLPVPATSIVGRGALAAALAERVAQRRLVTLVGPGGVGKTRLMLDIGHRLVAAAPDRPVALCELAGANEATAAQVVAAAVGVDDRPGSPLAERVADVVGDDDLVLLVDNCEHVLDPVAALVEVLLARCPGVRVVATSRERLRVPGEEVRVVPPLATDDASSPAARLFVERAQAVAPDLALDDDQRARVTEIVGRLDGLPLAIELAAARLHTLDLDELAAGLRDRRFDVLTAGARTNPRHESLGAAVAWSYEVLDDDLRRVFTDLSAFGRPFRVADAAAVCGRDEAAVAVALGELGERSLVQRTADRRYALLETLREFGAERLALTGRADEVARRHALHLVEVAATSGVRALDPAQPVFPELDEASPELQAAVDWLVDHDEVAAAGRLVGSLVVYGLLRLRPDVLRWADAVVAADPEDRSPEAARVRVALAYAAWMAGDVAEMGRLGQQAVRLGEAAGAVPAEALMVHGNLCLFEGRLDEAAARYRRGVEVATDRSLRLSLAATELLALAYAGAPEAQSRAAALLEEVGDSVTPYAAYVWFCAGEADLAVDVDRARARLARAVEMAEATGAAGVVGMAGASRVSIDARTGVPQVAAADYRRLIDHWRRAGMWSTQWTMLRSIAGLLERMGRTRDAAVLEGAVRSTAEGHRIFGADAAALDALGRRLREALGPDAYADAVAEGGDLDGDGAVEVALRAL